MKRIIFISLILTVLIYKDTYCQKKNIEKNSEISGVTGNNTITVVQGNRNTIKYNMHNDKEAKLFLNYLKTLPNISNEIKKLLNNDKKILTLLTKTYENTRPENDFYADKFLEKLETYIRDNEKLKSENEKLRSQTLNSDFADVIKNANEKLNNYDSEGFEKILEDYKNTKKQEIGKLSYLQAKNNFINYNFDRAKFHVDEAIMFDSLNVKYLFLKGVILSSLSSYKESLLIFLKLDRLENEKESKPSLYNAIGNAYLKLDSLNEGIKYFNKGLDICKAILICDFKLTLAIYNNLGRAYTEKGLNDKAYEFYTLVQNNQEQIYGKENMPTENVYNNIGLYYHKKGKFDLALEYYFKDLTIQQKLFNKINPQIAILYNNIGATYSEKGDTIKGKLYYEKSIKIKETLFGNESSTLLSSYSGIGSLYEKNKNYNRALEYYLKGMLVSKNLYGQDHINTSKMNVIIANIYKLKNDEDKSLEYYAKAFFYKFSDYEKASFLNKQGDIKFKLKHYNEALSFYAQSITYLEKSKTSQNDELWIRSYLNIANSYCLINKKMSTNFFEKALSLAKTLDNRELIIKTIKDDYGKCK